MLISKFTMLQQLQLNDLNVRNNDKLDFVGFRIVILVLIFLQEKANHL